MYSSPSRSSRIAALVIAGVAMIGTTPVTAAAQVLDGGVFGTWPYYTWYVSPYGGGATAYESFLRGQADVMRADGEQALNIARARVRHAEAVRRMLDNRERAFEQRLHFRRLGIAEQNAEFAVIQDRRDLSRALRDAEQLLEESEAAIRPNETRAEAKLRIAKSLVAGDLPHRSHENSVALDE